jgi:hypothetical protein
MDYSIILLENENIILDIVIYPYLGSYIKANLKNMETSKFKRLGSYEIVIQNIVENKENKFNHLKYGFFKKILDSHNDLIINFNTLKREKHNEYIFSIPIISGKINYLDYF